MQTFEFFNRLHPFFRQKSTQLLKYLFSKAIGTIVVQCCPPLEGPVSGFNSVKRVFSEFPTSVDDLSNLKSIIGQSDDCKRLSSSSHFEWYQIRSPTKYGRFRLPYPIIWAGQEKWVSITNRDLRNFFPNYI